MVSRDRPNSLERTENLASKGENILGKGKRKYKEYQIGEVVNHWVNKWL